jgi:hypothetical protein
MPKLGESFSRDVGTDRQEQMSDVVVDGVFTGRLWLHAGTKQFV